jgi:hypothetical protein
MRNIAVINCVQSVIEHSPLKFTSICIRNYCVSLVWISTQTDKLLIMYFVFGEYMTIMAIKGQCTSWWCWRINSAEDIWPKKVELTGDCRKLHNEHMHDLQLWPDVTWVIKARKMSWVAHVVLLGEERNAYSILLRKREWKRHFGRPRRKWEDNIKYILNRLDGSI